MSVEIKPTYVTLDPPYRLSGESLVFDFVGWAEVKDPAAPRIGFKVNGIETPVVTKPNPRVKTVLPGVEAFSIYAQVDFKTVLAALPEAALRDPFLLEVAVRTDDYERVFEYAVTDEWLRAVFGRDLKARPMPPEALQIRVAGAAAGGFHHTGRKVADQIADILASVGRPLSGFHDILDFGAGPGRVVANIRELNRTARLSASDIDPEAIAWAQGALGDVARFTVNPAEPPAPFADESFDLIYAISVFTHLPADLQWAWLSDLRRLLKPGGVLLTTKLDPAAYDLPEAVKAQGVDEGFVYWGEAQETDGLPSFYRLAYHTHDYVRREWGRYFEVLHVGSHDLNNTQDAIVLRRPRHGLSWLPSGLRKSLHGLVGPGRG